jgi:hypothetical protein
MRTVSAASVAANPRSVEGLPGPVLEALGELAGARRKGCWRSASASGSACCTS